MNKKYVKTKKEVIDKGTKTKDRNMKKIEAPRNIFKAERKNQIKTPFVPAPLEMTPPILYQKRQTP
jgi:hypothetical protein